jgi:hypothetical protein
MISVGMIDSTISNLNPYHCIIIDTLVEKNRDAITDSMEKKSEISCERQTLAFVMMTDDYSFFFLKIYGITSSLFQQLGFWCYDGNRTSRSVSHYVPIHSAAYYRRSTYSR